ncbi:MAG: aspartyl protease family protein [Sedimentisphaerales bacterium]|nr:aspartyl protease family protein [Sedimentisphaerales bacterium]
MRTRRSVRIFLVPVLVVLLGMSVVVQAARPGWQRQEVDWRLNDESRIRAIHYPQDKPPHMLKEKRRHKDKAFRKKFLPAEVTGLLSKDSEGAIIAGVIDSPPIDGFVPWITVTLTNERADEFDTFGVFEPSLVGTNLSQSPQTDYSIGLFDTGAGINIMGYADSVRSGVDTSYLTISEITIGGATGSVDTAVSYPLGIFIDSISAIDSITGQLDMSGMLGESNISIAVGFEPAPEAPDVPTVVGTPMSVFLATEFRNDQQVTIIHDANEFSGPNINLYSMDDENIPTYSNFFVLELRPAAGAVAYWPTIDMETFEFYPELPSLIMGDSMQSLFFVHSVNLSNDTFTLTDKDAFMFDTGAQVSVISTSIRTSLGLSEPSFVAEIQGVNGEVVLKDGYYIDSLDIPADVGQLSFTNIPVVEINVASPEGGFLDGIIGMNLFVDLNFVLHGGAFGSEPPKVEFEFIAPIVADIYPPGGDGVVNNLDLATFIAAWNSTTASANWNPDCDIFPLGSPDGKIDLFDYAVFAEHWRDGLWP